MDGFYDIPEPKLQSFLSLLGSDVNQGFEIPPYQRHFIWGQKRIQILFKDLFPDGYWSIIKNHGEFKKTLFLGCIVLCNRNATTVEVIDGQQRIIILSLTLLELLRRLKALDAKAGDEDFSENIVDIQKVLKSGPANTKPSERGPRLTLNSDDAAVWPAICENRDLKEFEYSESKILVQAYASVKTQIKNQLKVAKETGVDEKTALSAVAHRILRETSAIRFETRDEIQAFVLFETLNYRGVPLNAADLTKNKTLALGQRYGSKTYKDCREIWERITDVLGRKNLEVFLHHFWIGHFEKTGKQKLFEKISEYVSLMEKNELLEFLRELERLAQYYQQLINPQFPKGSPKSEREKINRLYRLAKFKAQTCRIILLYAHNHFPEEEDEIAKIVEAITVRGLAGSIQPRDIDKIYKDACADCHGDEPKSDSLLAALRSRLKPFIKKVNFGSDFSFLEFRQNDEKLRVLLARLNETFGGTSEIDFYKSDLVDIEHILSRKATQKARNEAGLTSDAKFDACVFLIGNLTLWHYIPNRQKQNGPYSKKRKDYVKSKVDITKDVGDRYTKWTEEAIAKRCGEMGLLAEKTWPLDIQ